MTVWDYLVAFITLGLLAIGLISMAVGKISDWRERRADRRDDPRDRLQARRARRPLPTRSVMSRARPIARTTRPQGGVAATTQTALPGSTVTGNAVNAALPGNAVNAALPADVRDIIRQQAQAEAVVRLLTSKKLSNKAETIELIFECSRSGRPNSPYQRALVLVDGMLDRYPQRTEEQEANRKELELSHTA
jgi:hypothetical protein